MYRVPHQNICYDANGVGNFLKGWLKTSFSFKGNAAPLPMPGAKKTDKPNFENLRAQCFYMLAEKTSDYAWYAGIADKTWGLIEEELEAHRKKDKDKLGKLKIQGKDEVKKILGRSPDYADMASMRIVFDLVRKRKARHRTF